MAFFHIVGLCDIFVFLLEQIEDLLGLQLFVGMIGNTFDHVADRFSHLRRQVQAVIVLQDVSDAALAGLAVDTNHIAVVAASHVLGIDRQIGNGPVFALLFLPELHALGNRILM